MSIVSYSSSVAVKDSKYSTIAKDAVSKTKIGYVNKVLQFFCDNNLLFHNEVQNIYLVKPKMAIIVGYYFDEYKTRNAIVEYLESLTATDEEYDTIDNIS